MPFPDAISILDYYHACEHLHDFSSSFFKDKEKEKKWTERQKELLLKRQVAKVIKHMKSMAHRNEKVNNLVAYYESNKDRMDYQKYTQM